MIETKLTDLNENDLRLLDDVDIFVNGSKEEGVDREQAKGEIVLMVNYIIMMHSVGPDYAERLKELVYTRFDEAWPEGDE